MGVITIKHEFATGCNSGDNEVNGRRINMDTMGGKNGRYLER